VKRLAELCRLFGLSAEAEHKLGLLLELLATDPAAPTSVTAPEEALDVHIADSLSALPVLGPLLASMTGPGTIVDIGSGGGFPGLPLAVALEPVAVDLVEATGRKCRFISQAVERLDQPNARAVCMRAEDWARAEGAGRYTLALVRAVAPLATLVEYASPLLTEGGSMIAWKGARNEVEERQGASAARSLGMAPAPIHRVTPFTGARRRHLHLFEKVGPSPPGVPRRAGLARKRPFGGK
jgi:16S rRNA (guanine527-N7)-methyltransferase